MHPPSDAILTVAQMQAAEQALVDRGTSIDELMQRAGCGAAEWVWRMAAGCSVTVLCGPGNNGGDGYVIARVLHERGLDVAVVAPLEPRTDAARKVRAEYRGAVAGGASDRHGHVLVDCLFGTGQTRPLSPELTGLVGRLAKHHHHAIAIDLPSNVASDSGECLGAVPRYDLTLALGAWKWAHWTMPAAARMGARRLVEIGIEDLRDAGHLIARPHLAAPSADAHKYRRGLVAVVGGAMPGAAALAAIAAQHAGAGYVKLLAERAPLGLPHSVVLDDRPLADALSDHRIAAILCGPGLGRDKAARARLEAVLECGWPAVLDADALMLVERADLPNAGQVVLTPHDGELAKLATTIGVANSGKRPTATAIADVTGVTVIAKGADTFVAAPGRIAVAPPASTWLSTAGTGDVLAGIVASRLATGVEPFAAAAEAVWLHGEAARLAGAAFSADDLAGRVAAAYAAAL
jgi:hydroxyethylthiazole kinase-like uncharacterized protein yjeF